MEAGIVGFPVDHSLSPLIHTAWLETTGLRGRYGRYSPATPEAFDDLVARGRAGDIWGVNVTAPYKERAFACADEASETARASRSANVLLFHDGRVLADSTDGEGLLWALGQQAPALCLGGAVVVMLGAGGAARAAVASLAGAGATVRLVNRTRARAEVLALDLGGKVEVGDPATAIEGAALVVNALSVSPEIDLSRLDSGAVVMDMTYRPVRTAFLKAAEAVGLSTVDGLAMLIGQAGPSFRAIFGMAPPDLDPRPSLLAYLGEAV
jgi:shikimate dehydrogenase